MVGTPQLPLKYRRKGGSDYRVYSSDLDVQLSSSTSSFDSYRFCSDYSIPHSPMHYSSSSSVAPSSPVRSEHTPEPSSSPLTEPYIASSPKSPTPGTRKGFWEVAFNYGPDFPYKGRPSTQASNFGREQFVPRRRSSSASAPTLVSDIEPSDYSEDNDPFHMDDDATDEENAPGSVTIVSSRDELAFSGPRASGLRHDNVDTSNSATTWDGEMDVAAVLLDLSRQVRFGSVESKAEDLAIKRTTLSSPDLARQDRPNSASVESTEIIHFPVQGTSIVTPVVLEGEGDSVSYDNSQDVELSDIDKRDTHGQNAILKPEGTRYETSIPAADDPTNPVDDEVCPTAEPEYSASLQGLHSDINPSSEEIAMKNFEDTSSSAGQSDIKSMSMPDGCAIVDEGMDPIAESIFSSVLTPLSSPALTGSELSELTEPLSGLSSPGINGLELTGPTDDTRHFKESDEMNMPSRPSSPVPGPSNRCFGSADQHDVPMHDATMKRKGGQSQKVSKKDKPRSVLEKETEQQRPDAKGKKKRARSTSAAETRPSSPSPSASCSDIPRPRKKRSRKIGEDNCASQDEDTALPTNLVKLSSPSSSSTVLASPLPAHGPYSVPQDVQFPATSRDYDADADAKAEMCGCLIQAMALSRASSMPASSLLREVLREDPHLADQKSKSEWLSLVAVILETHDVFGRVERRGLDADDKPLEAQWFYVPENDPDQERASLLREMMPKKRNETKKHKQYFFKPLGKISRWDPEDAP